MAEIKSLRFVTAVRLKKIQLLSCFHAFCNDPQIQALPHVDDGRDDSGLARVSRKLADERLVDLESINGKLRKITQARESRAEVIDRKAYPQHLEFLKHGRRGIGMFHKDAFGEL